MQPAQGSKSAAASRWRAMARELTDTDQIARAGRLPRAAHAATEAAARPAVELMTFPRGPPDPIGQFSNAKANRDPIPVASLLSSAARLGLHGPLPCGVSTSTYMTGACDNVNYDKW